MFDDFEIGPQSDEFEYDDSLRFDEMEQARGDYNLYEEEQVFHDREYDDSFADEMELGPEDDLGYEGE